MNKSSRFKGIRMILKAFALDFTGHGFSKLVKSKSVFMRIWWTLFILVAIAGCSYYIITSVQEYHSYQVITNIHNTYRSELLFPALTICAPSYVGARVEEMILECWFNERTDLCERGRHYVIYEMIDNDFRFRECVMFNGPDASEKVCLAKFYIGFVLKKKYL